MRFLFLNQDFKQKWKRLKGLWRVARFMKKEIWTSDSVGFYVFCFHLSVYKSVKEKIETGQIHLISFMIFKSMAWWAINEKKKKSSRALSLTNTFCPNIWVDESLVGCESNKVSRERERWLVGATEIQLVLSLLGSSFVTFIMEKHKKISLDDFIVLQSPTVLADPFESMLMNKSAKSDLVEACSLCLFFHSCQAPWREQKTIDDWALLFLSEPRWVVLLSLTFRKDCFVLDDTFCWMDTYALHVCLSSNALWID